MPEPWARHWAIGMGVAQGDLGQERSLRSGGCLTPTLLAVAPLFLCSEMASTVLEHVFQPILGPDTGDARVRCNPRPWSTEAGQE